MLQASIFLRAILSYSRAASCHEKEASGLLIISSNAIVALFFVFSIILGILFNVELITLQVKIQVKSGT